MVPFASKYHTNSIGLLRVLTTLLIGILGSAVHASPATDFALRNGLRVIVRERHTAPLVAMELWVRAGATAEAAGEFGAAHFLEHTLFKGTKTREVGGADIAIENLGATLNASTGPDYARYYTNVPSGHAAEALEVLADVVRNATLPAKEIDRERGVILNELAQRRSDPESQLIDRLYAIAYPDHAYARMPGGAEAAIRTQTREALSVFYRRCYRPDRCTLVFAGDITVEQAKEIAERAFGDWEFQKTADGKTAAEPVSVEGRLEEEREEGDCSPHHVITSSPHHPLTLSPPPSRSGDAGRTEVRITAADVAQPILGIAYRGPAAAARSSVCAAQIVAALLGRSDIGGRLSAPQLSGTDTKMSFGPRQDSSLLAVTTTLPIALLHRDRTHTNYAVEINGMQESVRAIVNGLLTSPPTAGELQAAKSALIGRMIFENETNSGLASAAGLADVTGGMPPDEWRATIERTSLVEVRDFIKRYLDSTQRIELTLVPAARRGEPNVR